MVPSRLGPFFVSKIREWKNNFQIGIKCMLVNTYITKGNNMSLKKYSEG